jgi:sulfoquinovosidase
MRIRRLLLLSLLSLATVGPFPPEALAADETFVDAGPLRARIEPEPFRLVFLDERGTLLADAPSADPTVAGALGFRGAAGWRHGTRLASASQVRAGDAVDLVLETDDPDRRRLGVHIAPVTAGVIEVELRVEGGPTSDLVALGGAWETRSDERFFGLGERADAVQHRGADVESYVSDGPYVEDEWPLIGALLPPPGFRRRADATYFPMPWILSSRGYGVLVANDETAYHHLATERSDAWSFEVRGAPEGMDPRPAPRSLRFLVFSGPRPADALERFSRWVGRQPPAAAPWVFGPWFQPGGSVDDQVAQVVRLRERDAPLSVAQTYFHYLPCGGDRASEPRRTGLLHSLGVAVTTYFNPMLCQSYEEAFRHAERIGALARTQAGAPYLYTYFTSRPFIVGQYDFSWTGGRRAFQSLLADAVADGHDGWMEDFGEYTPLDVRTADGRDGSATHNRYVVDYHCAGYSFARRQGRPVVRFQRSGWTGAARCAQVVWGGDPTTGWGYDGLSSSVRAGLGMGLSGVGIWGSDIGGFFSFNGRLLTEELLARWIEFGAVSGVMRTQRDGIAVPAYDRPQVEDESLIAIWRRYAKLRTQLYPYVAAAAAEYRRRGMPIMRHLVLAHPDDPEALDRDDEFYFGPDLLAAPVIEPGATTRRAYLPGGEWIDFWRAVRFVEADGSFELGRAEVLAGGREVDVPAPLEELPLFVRAGAVIPLLLPDVDTLADYGAGTDGLVRLADRRGERRLLAFPRGDSESRLPHGTLTSRELARAWTLEIAAPSGRWSIAATLATLARPFSPCAVEWRGEPLAREQWSFDEATGVFRTDVSGAGLLRVSGACRVLRP